MSPYDRFRRSSGLLNANGQSGVRADVLRAQYDRCRQDMVQFDAMLWQIPGVAYVINAAGLGFVLSGDVRDWGGTLVAVSILILTLPLTLALVKNRMFQESRMCRAKELLIELGGGQLKDIPTKTGEALKLLESEESGSEKRKDAVEKANAAPELLESEESRSGKRKGAVERLVSTVERKVVEPLVSAVESFLRPRGAYNALVVTLLFTHVGQVIFAVASPVCS